LHETKKETSRRRLCIHVPWLLQLEEQGREKGAEAWRISYQPCSSRDEQTALHRAYRKDAILMRFFNHRRHGHVVGSVYLVHFARRYHGAQHYMGFSTNIPERVKAHRAGRGAPLLAAVSRHGIT
jgi:hypothetical protein